MRYFRKYKKIASSTDFLCEYSMVQYGIFHYSLRRLSDQCKRLSAKMAAETRTLWFGLKFAGFRVNSKFVQGQSTDQICSLLSKKVAYKKKVFATKSCLIASDEINNAIDSR